MNFKELDELARETFELGSKLGQKLGALHRFDQMSDEFLDQIDRDEFWQNDNEHFELEKDQIAETLYPSASGIIYKLEKGTSTFCLRAIAVDNIEEDMEDVIKDHRGLRKQLRMSSELTDQEVQNELHYFETPIVENAQILVETFCHQRFPIKEHQLCNISDPGHNWWLEETPTQLTIHFRAPSIEREKGYLNLGPLGDARLAVSRLQRLEKHFQKSMPGLTIKGSDRHLIFEVNGDQLMTPLKKLFRDGENAWINDERMNTTLYLFLEELAVGRRFWKQIAQLLQ